MAIIHVKWQKFSLCQIKGFFILQKSRFFPHFTSWYANTTTTSASGRIDSKYKLCFIIDKQVDFFRWEVPDLKGYLQQRGITCHLYRKPDLAKLCELPQKVGNRYVNK
jgi:hypothetical protein